MIQQRVGGSPFILLGPKQEIVPRLIPWRVDQREQSRSTHRIFSKVLQVLVGWADWERFPWTSNKDLWFHFPWAERFCLGETLELQTKQMSTSGINFCPHCLSWLRGSVPELWTIAWNNRWVPRATREVTQDGRESLLHRSTQWSLLTPHPVWGPNKCKVWLQSYFQTILLVPAFKMEGKAAAWNTNNGVNGLSMQWGLWTAKSYPQTPNDWESTRSWLSGRPTILVAAGKIHLGGKLNSKADRTNFSMGRFQCACSIQIYAWFWQWDFF